ncbi:alanine racemase [Methylobacterium sp. 4-46]|uniref:Alanine racemase n=1 Tax=Methylobacterium sp. (strain 4-46) TaxID=426117 RepID=ALR_METS4|nr:MULTISPECIES: alanine racemase [Methylobacterium]B0UL34.1 RecName: Full=Alanine racemase [Methylobacterium sp. 4-46]ACA17034.1 alanine racemase [Methylobacterium sp. 4-46]WFT82723.1 alanine racemase [Methylobacterium nodulans]
MTATSPHGARLTINLRALAANWRRLAEEAAGAECAAVIKADAYGTGIDRAGPALWRAGCRTFFVAHLSEAERARAALPEAVIYVLNGLPPGSAPAYRDRALRPVLGSREEIEEWAAFCRARGERLPAALHVDTGMNRLGLSPDEALALAGGAALEDVAASLLVSHLVSAEVPGDAVTARQVADFARVAAAFPGLTASLGNSAGTFLGARARHEMVRPGYALYGGNPRPGGPNPMRPVVRLDATILQVRDVPPGATAGYNARWTAPGPRRLATLSLGYADGYPRAGSGRAEAVVAGRRCPVVGTISMDLVILDVTDAPPEAARRGARATLIGEGLDIDEVGQRAGTIGYEILTNLGRRSERAYID